MSESKRCDRGRRIAVVVIVRDGERYLDEALQSIAAQSEHDWEAVIVDDGSTDRTAAIAERFAAEHGDRCRVVRHDGGANLGMSASRNLGVAATDAPYVTFLDHDDVMLPAKLAAQAALLDAHPEAGAVIGPNLRWHRWQAADLADEVQDLGATLDRVHAPPSLLPVFLARTTATPLAPMVRRSAIECIGGYDPSFRGMYEDQVFLARLLLSFPVYVSSDVWHRYRQHRESCVSRAHRAGSHLAARRQFLRWLCAELDRHPAVAPPVRRVARAQLLRVRLAAARAVLTRRR